MQVMVVARRVGEGVCLRSFGEGFYWGGGGPDLVLFGGVVLPQVDSTC